MPVLIPREAITQVILAIYSNITQYPNRFSKLSCYTYVGHKWVSHTAVLAHNMSTNPS